LAQFGKRDAAGLTGGLPWVNRVTLTARRSLPVFRD
jgi:hypothetical protein